MYTKLALTKLDSLKTTLKKELIIKALYDFCPCDDDALPAKGLEFHFGDILHVTNASDPEWWQAKHLSSINSPGSQNNVLGLIPSKSRAQRRQKQRTKKVNFYREDYIICSSMKDHYEYNDHYHFPINRQVSNSFIKRITDRLVSKVETSKNQQDLFETKDGLIPAEISCPYENVELIQVPYPTRLVVIFGPLKEFIMSKLLEKSDSFATCTSYTSRPKRADEIENKNFHFVADPDNLRSKIEAGDFIDWIEAQGHIYATSAEDIEVVLKKNRVCILELSVSAIQRLSKHNLHPFLILIKPDSAEILRHLIPNYSLDQAKKAFELCQILYETLKNRLSAVVAPRSHNQALLTVENIINNNCKTNKIWVASETQNL